MLRRASKLDAAGSHTCVVGWCAAASSPFWHSSSSSSSCNSSAMSFGPTASAALATPRRSFFPPGTSGKDFLRHLITPAAPTQAFSPLETFRPPAPPSAADAQPFGSLNRTNQLRRYVNVNTAAGDTGSDSAHASGASISGEVLSTTSTSNFYSTSTSSRNRGSERGARTTGAASTSRTPPSRPARMDLSKLVRRHTSHPTGTTTAASPLEGATTTTTSSSSSSVANVVPPRLSVDAARDRVDATQSAPPAAAAAAAAAAHPRAPNDATSTHATVARAQAAIAAAQRRKEAAQNSSPASHEASRPASPTRAHGGLGAHLRKAAGSGKGDGEHKDDRSGHSRQHVQVYKEHCTIGWSPEEFYRVVADVEHYTDFLPWCAGSEVHTTRRVQVPRGRRLLPGNLPSEAQFAAAAAHPVTGTNSSSSSTAAAATADARAEAIAAAEAELVEAIEMTATLTIGFSFLKEQYTSRVTLYPGTKIVAALYDDAADAEAAAAVAGGHGGRGGAKVPEPHDSFVVSLFKKAASTAGAAAKRSILKHLMCEWEFCPVPGKPNMVEVVFSVSFEFKNPLHGHMIMSNVVTLMTRSFERRCENLYGPPSASKESLPLFH